MRIHSTEVDTFFFSAPYTAKRLLQDSVERTLKGYRAVGVGSVVRGVGNILLARVESAVAFSFVALSATVLTAVGVVMASFFLVPITALNIFSRAPGISSDESMKNFRQESDDMIYRSVKVSLVAMPVIFLFLSASGINTFLPGVLKPNNVLFSSIHKLVESFGPLQTIHAIVPGVTEAVGTEREICIPGAFEEYCRALSTQNYMKEVSVSSLTRYCSYRMY